MSILDTMWPRTDDESFKFIDIICVISLYFEPPRELFAIEQAPQSGLTGEGEGTFILLKVTGKKDRTARGRRKKRERTKRKKPLYTWVCVIVQTRVWVQAR